MVQCYPFLLMPLKSFSLARRSMYAFIDTLGNWSNGNDGFDKYGDFISRFNIIILQLTKSKANEFSFISNILDKVIVFKYYMDINALKQQMIETIKSLLLIQGSIIILYNNKVVSSDLLVNVLINLFYYMTYYSLKKIKAHLNSSCAYFIKNIRELLNAVQQESLQPLCSLNQIELSKSFEALLFALHTEMKSKFKPACSVIERIILNMILYPNNEIYYR